MSSHVMLVLTNAQPGEDDEFNRWYDEQHVTDVLGQGPFTSVRRFRLADGDGWDAPYRYLAVYDIVEGKLDEARAWLLWSRTEREEALAAGRDPRVPVSPTLADGREAWFFEAITERSTDTLQALG